MKKNLSRILSLMLALCLLGGCAVLLSACSKQSEIPEGYQYATCKGEYFRLFVPTQWTVSTESGVSGATISLLDNTAVSMAEVYYEPEEGEATLDAFVADHIAEVSRMTGYKAEKNLDATLNRHRAKDITYTAEVAGVAYRYRQVLTKVEGRFYIFTYSSAADGFDRFLDIVDGILENVVFYAVPFEGSEDNRKIPQVNNTPAGMKLVSTNEVIFRFFAPEDWIVVPGSATFQVCASETDSSNVSVLGYVPGVSCTIADYWKETEKQYKDAFSSYTLISETKGKMGGFNATIYEYTYSLGGVSYHARQAICVPSSYMMLNLTYTALEENYALHLADVDAMQAALTFRRGGQSSEQSFEQSFEQSSGQGTAAETAKATESAEASATAAPATNG